MLANAVKEEILLAMLQKELQDSEVYAQQLTAMFEEHFARAYDSDLQAPRINKVSITPVKSLDYFSVCVNVTAQVNSVKNLVSYDVTLPVPVNWSGSESEDVLAQQIHSALPLVMEIAVREIQKRLPKGEKETVNWYLLPRAQRIDAVLSDLMELPDVKLLFQEKQAAMQASLLEQQAKAPCPPGFQLANITALQMRWEINSNIVGGTLRVELDHGLYSEKPVRFPLGDCPCYIQDPKEREYLLECFTKIMMPFVMQLKNIPLVYIAVSPWKVPGMTEPLVTLLKKGSVCLDQVTVKWRRPCNPAAFLLYMPLENNEIVRLGKRDSNVRKCPAVILNPTLLDLQQLPLGQYHQLPRDLAGLCRLGETLETFLEEAFQGKEIPAPQVMVKLGKHSQLHIKCGTKSATFDKEDVAAGSKLQTLVEQAIAIEMGKPLERQRHLELLNTLNPIELAILRYIASCPDVRGAAVTKEMENQGCTTKAYASTCLQHLKALEVPWAGKAMPLLQIRSWTNGELDDNCEFRVGRYVDREMLASASGRPFHLEETSVLKPAERAKWFTNYLLEADDEQRWTRFNEALDRMPNTFLAAFAKSDEGQAFLKGFTGDEAMFVRLTVEGLPGFKRLAAKLWREEAESGEE